MNLEYTKMKIPFILNRAQWILVAGIFFYNRVEVITTFIAVFLIIYHYGSLRKSSLLKYMLGAFIVSFVTAFFCGYTISKMIQQMAFISIVYLLYEQFFKRNVLWLKELFIKFIKVSYWICWLGILELLIWVLVKYDISNILDCQWFTGMPGMTIEMGPFIRVRATNLEGGCLGEQLIPSLVYLFYYNDSYQVLKGKQKYVVLFAALFTVSPFVYVTLVVIIYLKAIKFMPKLKTVFVVLGISLGTYSVSLLQKNSNIDQQITGIEGILVRLKDTSSQLAYLNDRDATLQGNVSTAVLMTNLYSAINAPSRILGTGIGTNRQNYEHSYGFYRTYENDVTDLNLDDAYSLGIRIFSEFGYLGILLFVFFLKKHFKGNIINTSMLTMIIPFVFRGGVYVGYGTSFMFFLYYYSCKMNKYLK